MNPSTIQNGLVFLASALLSSLAWAGDGEVITALSPNPPAKGVLFSFEGQDQKDGWGWYRLESERRDPGISFRSPGDDSITKITCLLQNVPNNFPEAEGFTLRIFKTENVNENPTDGEEVYKGQGRLALRREDKGLYLTLSLDHPVPVAAGAVYTIFLSWDREAETNIVSLGISPGAVGGLVWYLEGKSGSTLKHLNQSDNPGLIFYIQ